MGKISYGCQTYPWKMNISRYAGDLPHIAETTARAGFEGLEAEICMLGKYFDDPVKAKCVLDQHGLKLAAVVLHQEWEHERETEEETALTKKTIEFARRFPNAKIMVSHHAGHKARPEGEELKKRRENLLACMDSVASRAGEAGIVTCYHPNSAENSLFRTGEDYEVLFEMLERTDVGYAPDIGHIVNGGMDPIKILKMSRKKIRHVHFKDRAKDGAWAVMGEGNIDYPAVVEYLRTTDYGGWIMVEDESVRAETNSDGVVMADGNYMARFF